MTGPTFMLDLSEMVTALGLTTPEYARGDDPLMVFSGPSGTAWLVVDADGSEVVALVVARPPRRRPDVEAWPTDAQVFAAMVSISRPLVDDEAERLRAALADVAQLVVERDEARHELAALAVERDALAVERDASGSALAALGLTQHVAVDVEDSPEVASAVAERVISTLQNVRLVETAEGVEVTATAPSLWPLHTFDPLSMRAAPLRREADSVLTPAMVDEVNRAENERTHAEARALDPAAHEFEDRHGRPFPWGRVSPS